MRITLHTNDGKRLAATLPYPAAPAVKVSRVCDCGCQAVRCMNVDTRTRDTIAGDAECGGCGKPVGRLVVTLDGMYTAHVDFPVRYHDGAIAYDRPEIIPARVRAAVKRAFCRQDEWRAQTVNRI